MCAAMLASRAAAPWQVARSPPVAMPPTPPHQPPCTLRFASLFESDDEGDDTPREACAPQTPTRCVGSSAVPGSTELCCAFGTRRPPPALPVLGRSGMLGALPEPGGSLLPELACIKRVIQLSAPESDTLALLASLSSKAVACAGAAGASSSALAVHVAAALRSGGYATAQAAGATHESLRRRSHRSSPACAHTRALLDRAGRHAFVTVTEPSGVFGTLIVEPRLREQFEIPRPSAAYAASLNALPAVFVGTAQRLAVLVAWMAARLRAAFDAEGMHVPPWRSARAMLAMWRLDTHAGVAAASAAEHDVAVLLAGGRTAPGIAAGADAMHTQRNGAPYPVRVSACTPPGAAAAWRGRPGAA